MVNGFKRRTDGGVRKTVDAKELWLRFLKRLGLCRPWFAIYASLTNGILALMLVELMRLTPV